MERVRLIRRHLQLHAQTMRGRVDFVGWGPPEDLSEDEWAEVGILLARIDASTPWWVGDWWNHGVENYGDRKMMVESPAWPGPSFQTCANPRRFVEHSKLPVDGKFSPSGITPR